MKKGNENLEQAFSQAEDASWESALAHFDRLLLAGLDILHARPVALQLEIAEAYGRRGDIELAQAIIADAYERDRTLNDRHVRLARAWSHAGASERALQVAQIDERLGRLSPSGSVTLALLYAQCGRAERAAALVQRAYAVQSDLLDGHALVAQLFASAKSWETAREWYEKDLELDRLGPSQRFFFAVCLARLGRWESALEMVESAYDASGALSDCFSRLGWIKTETEDWQGALEIVQRDLDLGRMSAGWALNLALLHAHGGNDETASRIVEDAYAKDPGLRDGYARLAWFKAQQKDWPAALCYADLDLQQGRLSPAGQVNLAQVLGQLGAFDEAARLVTDAYNVDAGLRDGRARLGWIETVRGDWQHAHQIMQQDEVADRLTPEWTLRYAEVCARTGNVNEASQLFAEVLDGPPQNQGLLRDWLAERLGRQPSIPSRYDHLLTLFRAESPRRMVEIGVWRGDRALRFLSESACLEQYVGFDLFESISPGTFCHEGMGRCDPVGRDDVLTRLAPVAALRSCEISLIAGPTLDTLPGFAAANAGRFDFVFVDGGHSLETIANDWQYASQLVRHGGLIVLDDYYLNETARGAKPLVDELVNDARFDVRFFPMVEDIVEGLQITMAAVRVIAT